MTALKNLPDLRGNVKNISQGFELVNGYFL